MSTSDRIALAGVIANLILALVAVVVPVWQRRAMLGDAQKAERRSWNRFIEAFKELGAVLEAVAAANSVGDFTEIEPKLRSAMDAFAISAANPLPVKAALNASRVQQMATEILSQFPDLKLWWCLKALPKLYGPNLFTYKDLKAKLKEASEATRLFLRQARELEI